MDGPVSKTSIETLPEAAPAAELGRLATEGYMTVLQICLFGAAYLIFVAVVVVLTRATLRRVAGSLAGGIVAGVAGLGVIALGQRVGWWDFVMLWEPSYLVLFLLAFAISMSWIYLISWRIARRFGWRGLAVGLIAVAVIGPPRDYWYMAKFPEWGSFGSGIIPILVDSASYVLMVVVGHGVMRLVAGPARADRLARRPWEVVKPT
jgi:hypothetical protein